MKTKIIVIAILVIILLSVFSNASALDIKSTNDKFTIDTSDEADWTIMLYLDVDNDIDPLFDDKLKNFEEIYSTESIEIIVLIDNYRQPRWEEKKTSATKLYHLNYSAGSYDYKEDLGELNMGDPQTLINFVYWSVDNYPAKNYFLSLIDHGGGWGGICVDITNGSDALNMSELEYALKSISLKINKKLDVLFFDACSMGQIETYYSIYKYVEYVVSSEATRVANAGEHYTKIVSELINNPDWSPEQVAIKTASSFWIGNFATIAFKTDKIADIVNEIKNLATYLINDIKTVVVNFSTS